MLITFPHGSHSLYWGLLHDMTIGRFIVAELTASSNIYLDMLLS